MSLKREREEIEDDEDNEDEGMLICLLRPFFVLLASQKSIF